jgi:hypothetical protein
VAAGLFAWPPGGDHAVPWSLVWLLGEPTLDSEWSIGTGAAPVGFCGIGVTNVGLSLITRAVGGSRGPCAIARGLVVMLSRVRHGNRFASGHSGNGGRFPDGE